MLQQMQGLSRIESECSIVGVIGVVNQKLSIEPRGMCVDNNSQSVVGKGLRARVVY